MQVSADEYEMDTETGWATGSGNVRITYRGMVVEADTVRVNVQTKDFEAGGNIFFYRLDEPGVEAPPHEFFWRGEEIKGNLDTREFSGGTSRGRFDEWFAVAGTGQFDETGDAIFKNVHLSTCEHLLEGHAHYRIEAREVIYQQKDGRFVAKHAVYKVGSVPVFYWPYVAWDTRSDGGNIKYRVGHRDDWGAFLSIAKGWNMGGGADTEYRVDLMSDRGVAIVNNTTWFAENGFTKLHLYGLADTDPPEDPDGMNRRFDSRDSRYRAKIFHYVEPAEKLTLRVNADKLSDIDMLEEWYRREFEDYRQPRNEADMRYDSERFSASINVRFRLNSFYTVSERLPELRLDMPRQQLFDSPLYYQSETSFAYLRMNMRDFDQPYWWPAFPDDMTYLYDRQNFYESARFDTVQMLYLPFKAGDLLQIVPRAGIRLTYYSATSENEVSDDELRDMFRFDDPDLDLPVNNVSLYDEDGGDTLRFAAETGLEVTTKMVGTWQDAKSDFWQVDGFRHVVQPYANYSYVSEPSEDKEHLMYFDETERLRGENFVRFGVRQRVQTRRQTDSGQRIYTLARVDTYADVHLDTSDEREVAGDFATRLRANPIDNLAVWGTVLADMHRGELRWLEIGTRLGDPDRLAVTLSYVSRDEYRRSPVTTFGSTTTDYTGENITSGDLGDVSALSLAINGRINDLTTASAHFLYDFEEEELASHVYELGRDLHCWTGSLFVGEDYGDFMIGIMLRLKAFPDIGIEADIY